ncbi:flavodoxin family protein [Actinoplanes missouriensis]|uniref:flavodoxin family protein n=1 Tax=Actinoplanes missouriensis TaxID=1866 RepID=UPI0033D0B079
MRALVVYESMFGNTATIARAVADGLAETFQVTVAEVHSRPPATGMDLLVVGAPTHAFGLSRSATRADAARQGEVRDGAQEYGVREYLDDLSLPAGSPVAAFDTKMNKPMLTGSAARKAARKLHGLGARVLLPAQSFRVGGTTGPLIDGEPERARQWAKTVAAAMPD